MPRAERQTTQSVDRSSPEHSGRENTISCRTSLPSSVRCRHLPRGGGERDLGRAPGAGEGRRVPPDMILWQDGRPSLRSCISMSLLKWAAPLARTILPWCVSLGTGVDLRRRWRQEYELVCKGSMSWCAKHDSAPGINVRSARCKGAKANCSLPAPPWRKARHTLVTYLPLCRDNSNCDLSSTLHPCRFSSFPL